MILSILFCIYITCFLYNNNYEGCDKWKYTRKQNIGNESNRSNFMNYETRKSQFITGIDMKNFSLLKKYSERIETISNKKWLYTKE